MHSRPVAILVAPLCALALVLAGCGGSDDNGSVEVRNRPAPAVSEFPATARPCAPRRTLAAVLNQADAPSSLVVSPASMVFSEGSNRYSFGVFRRDGSQVPDAEVALYIAKAPPLGPDGTPQPPPPPPAPQPRPPACPPPQSQRQPQDVNPAAAALLSAAYGPFPARVETLETEPAFRSRLTVDDPEIATAAYVAQIDFPSEGEWRVGALIKAGGEYYSTLLPSPVVGQFDQVPQEGDRAPVIDTPTLEDVGGDASELTTRVPPDTMLDTNLADVLGEQPVVLLFATPAFCQSRVCGPMVDIAEQVKRDYEDEAAFIHVEIFNDNDPSKGVRPQVRAYHLPSEPWLYVIDRNGIIRTAIEGPFSVQDLTRAVENVTAG